MKELISLASQMSKVKTAIEVNQLTLEECGWIYGMYNSAINPECKLELKPLRYITDADVYMLCSRYSPEPFHSTKPDEWVIRREGCYIKVFRKYKEHAYIIDTDNGNIAIYRNEMSSHLGVQVNAAQFFMRRRYAFPLDFEPGHWANGKTPLELGIAVPDKAPLLALLGELYDHDQFLIKDWEFDRRLHNVDLNNITVYDIEYANVLKQLKEKKMRH